MTHDLRDMIMCFFSSLIGPNVRFFRTLIAPSLDEYFKSVKLLCFKLESGEIVAEDDARVVHATCSLFWNILMMNFLPISIVGQINTATLTMVRSFVKTRLFYFCIFLSSFYMSRCWNNIEHRKTCQWLHRIETTQKTTTYRIQLQIALCWLHLLLSFLHYL